METINFYDARISGAHVNGCAYGGGAESWTSADSYDIWELVVTGCPEIAGVDINGTYSGSAAIIEIEDDGRDEMALVIGLSNEENQITQFLYRL